MTDRRHASDPSPASTRSRARAAKAPRRGSARTAAGEPQRARTVLIAGDVTLDWNLAGEAEREGQTTHACRQWGGAALLGDLIAALAHELEDGASMPIAVHAPARGDGTVAPGDRRFHHRYALWTRRDDEERNRAFTAWRVERFLGEERAAPRAGAVTDAATDGGAGGRPDLIVLHDAGLGFRDRRELWPRALREPGEDRPWVLLRLAKPVDEPALWQQLRPFAARTIVVVHIDDLRTGAVQVARELSWERTAEDLMSELLYRTHLRGLAECAHVVVSFTTAGALVYSGPSGGKGPRGTLVFDPAAMERMFNEQHPGNMIGGVSALAAGIARQLLLEPEAPDVILGVRRGVAALRDLDLHGYAEEPPGSGRIAFPARRLVGPQAGDPEVFKEVPVPDPSRLRPAATGDAARRRWTILEARHPDALEALARRVVLEGPEDVLADVPHGRFGDLLTFDRNEIEGFQSIRTLIRHYAENPDASEPLSIAVFGPPGSGKSWSVKEIARSILGRRVKPLTFNLSQFDAPDALIDAFHRVRDIALAGRLPLVFWDEFDTTKVTAGVSQEFGWLPHFLSPMEDGKFQDGQLTHPIGRAVFVFGGGVCHTMSAFHERIDNDDEKRLLAVKAPDFLSRLDGYVDIVGPDPAGGDAAEDPYYLIRRAVLVRALLRQRAKSICRGGRPDIDSGVLHALLRTPRYRHGVRSLGSIISTSASGRTRFAPSDLPAEAQLHMHVDATAFLDLIHRAAESEIRVLDCLAEAMHVRHCAEALERGSAWAEPSEDYLRSKPLLRRYAGRERGSGTADPTLIPYERLSDERKQAWRDQVSDIPAELTDAGFVLEPVCGTEPLSELLRLRCGLETAIVRRAAAGDRAPLARAHAALAEMRGEGVEPASFDDADIRFHLALSAASRNEAMHLLMLAVRDAIAAHLLRALNDEPDFPAARRRLTDEHAAILEAIEGGDGERAARLMQEHIMGFYRRHPAELR